MPIPLRSRPSRAALLPWTAWIVLALLSLPALASDRVPGEVWMRYSDPAEAGYDAAKLEEARAFYESLVPGGASGALVVADGAVLAAWGDVERRYLCHSTRKSLMAGAYGVQVDRGAIDLMATMADLGIDDRIDEDDAGLTEAEQQATVLHLLQARSGVYRLAAYEPPQNPKPERHSHAAGTNWCYNNWDFNTLVTIYQDELGVDFFEDFGRELATPLGMQDFRPRDGYLHYELDKSEHPAYPFRMSARDMARFGLLYERGGLWGERRLLSEDWVERCRTSYSDAWNGDGYGLLWWIAGDEDLAELGMYSALGLGGHAIDVLPGADLVLVFRVDTYRSGRVSSEQRRELLRLLLAARTGAPAEEPALEPLPAQDPMTAGDLRALTGVERPVVLSDDERRAVLGLHELDGGVTARIDEDAGGYFVTFSHVGSHDLIPLGRERFLVDDVRWTVAAVRDDAGLIVDLIDPGRLNGEGYAAIEAGEPERAVEVLTRCVSLFPEQANWHDSLGDALAAAGRLEEAAQSFRTAYDLSRANGDGYADLFRANWLAAREAAGLPALDEDPAPPTIDMTTPDATLDALYDAISFAPGGSCDYATLRALFHPGARLAQPGASEPRGVDVEGFVSDFQGFLEGSGCDAAGFTERPVHRRVETYGGLAHAFVTFEATLGTRPDQPRRGLDAVALVRTGDAWRIVSITTEWEQEDAPLEGGF